LVGFIPPSQKTSASAKDEGEGTPR
jgi:hypothetical protein